MIARDPITHLLSNYIPEPNTGCWLWLGPYTVRGYGMLSLGQRKQRVYAHRKMLSLIQPNSNPDMYACHRCDVPSCINPDHLFWCTQADNLRDARTKGRMSAPPRTKMFKLTNDKIKDIMASSEVARLVAARHGICAETVRRVRRKEYWRNPI